MITSRFTFRFPEWRETDPRAWITWWAARYDNGDNPEYFALIAKKGALSAEDFEQAGKWKEGCLKPGHGRWKTATPVAYDIWMEAKAELPACPEKSGVKAFLEDWARRKFAAGAGLQKRFGLSRSTTLLHFVSGGVYPILDARVETAMQRLGSPIEASDTADGYLNSFCPLFLELAKICEVSDVAGWRLLDNALFNYGAETSYPDKSLR